MDGVVSSQERSIRSKKLRILSQKLQRSFYEKYINTSLTALFEKEDKNNYLQGFTDNYIKVKIPYNKQFCKTKQQIKLLNIDNDGVMIAEIL